jgi:hypothetical protein
MWSYALTGRETATVGYGTASRETNVTVFLRFSFKAIDEG